MLFQILVKAKHVTSTLPVLSEQTTNHTVNVLNVLSLLTMFVAVTRRPIPVNVKPDERRVRQELIFQWLRKENAVS